LPQLTNQDWIDRLKSADNSAALEELRRQLTRGLTYALYNRVPPEQLDDLVEDFTQDSVLRILEVLDTFRGESRFLTWATKITVRLAFSELRRKRYQDVPLDVLTADPDQEVSEINTLLTDPAQAPEAQVNRDELLGLVGRLIDEELTPRQRDALRAVMESDLPMEEVARRMGSTRNAFYKMVYDARQRLLNRLAEHGLSLADLLSAAGDEPG
jgi:RNA polymerase sigma factor (sigma-70 family)